MRVLRFDKGDGTYGFGVTREDSDKVTVLAQNPLLDPDNIQPSGQILDLGDIRLVAPVIPASKVVCVGKNYLEHIREFGSGVPDAPILFLKPNTAVIGTGAPIVLPSWSREVHHEVELAVVIGRPAKDIRPADWRDYVFGYTIGNDVSARDAQRADKQWTRAKSFDTSCPLGPWITVDPDLDVQNLRIRSEVDGEVRQDDTTANMMHPVSELVTYASQAMTLLPGDVLMTGTPAGVGPITAGQTVTCEIEGLGKLVNPVRR